MSDVSAELRTELTLLAAHTERLVATCADLEDAGAASLCEGWTRAHVLTHVARNAEAIGRLADWAVTGEAQPMYPGGAAARDAAIEAGAGRSVAELHADVRDTARALEPRLSALDGTLRADRVEMRGGLQVSARALPFLRLREVVFHHVDLDAGFGFQDVDAALLGRFIEDAVTRLGRDPRAPGLTLQDEDGREWRVGEATAVVSGPASSLLLWLARQDASGVRSEGPLPDLPRGA